MPIIDKLVPIYLMSCYLYHEHDTQVLDDPTHDDVCQTLYKYFDEIKHYHKKYLDRESLHAGTGFGIQWDTMPSIIKTAACQWRNTHYYEDKEEMKAMNRLICKCEVAYEE